MTLTLTLTLTLTATLSGLRCRRRRGRPRWKPLNRRHVAGAIWLLPSWEHLGHVAVAVAVNDHVNVNVHVNVHVPSLLLRRRPAHPALNLHSFVNIATSRSSSSSPGAFSFASIAPRSSSVSNTAAHSIAEPRAMAYVRAASALPVRLAASAMLSATELPARRSWSRSAAFPRGAASETLTTKAKNSMAHR